MKKSSVSFKIGKNVSQRCNQDPPQIAKMESYETIANGS